MDRKLTRFFVINPVNDRRNESRFESHQNVAVTLDETGLEFIAVAHDIGQKGLRLETTAEIELGHHLQIVFKDNAENICCFGRVVWSAKKEENNEFRYGLSIDSWRGIVKGAESWKRYKGFKVKRDRRRRPR